MLSSCIKHTEIHDNVMMSKYNFHITAEKGISSKRIVFLYGLKNIEAGNKFTNFKIREVLKKI